MSTKKKEHQVIKEQFGRYLLLDHLVDGGMAKICRARYLGEQAEKIVAIKMVQPQFSQDENFRKMFEDEVKVSFGLQHPNIAQTYDYGMMNGQLYTAMEYVDGKNLKQYLDELKRRKVLFPIEVSVYIVSLACQGLHYAHTYTDKLTGQKLNLVHRDISPHNLMLTYDGAVKVIDFGIAKAETNSDATQAGTIKGKLSYLAPEYLEGMQLDGRYDEFALGIVLWEMLCSRKLFTAANELAVLKEIQKCKVPPPSSINPTVPKELDQIVLKALSKDRNQRYEDLDKFNRALTKFLYTKYENFNPSDLGKFASALFKKEIEADRVLMREFGRIDVKPFLENLKNGGMTTHTTTTPSAESADEGEPQGIKKAEVFDFDMDANDNTGLDMEGGIKGAGSPGRNEDNLKKKAKPGLNRPGVTSTSIKIGKPSLSGAPRPTAKSDATRSVKVSSKKKSASKKDRTKTKTKMRSPKRSSAVPKVASIAIIAMLGLGGAYFTLFNGSESEKAVTQVQHEKTVAEQTTREPSSQINKRGEIRLVGFEKFKHEVFVNGKPVRRIDFGEFSVPTNKKLTIRVQQKDHKHFIKEVELNGTEEEPVEIELQPTEPMRYGYLINSDRNCVDGKLEFTLFGEKRVEKLPIRSKIGIPVPVGTMKFSLIRSGDMAGTTKEITVKQQDEVVDLCEKFLW